MQIKSTNPRLTQDQIAKQLGNSTSSLLRYRRKLNMFSPYRISLKRKKKTEDYKHRWRR